MQIMGVKYRTHVPQAMARNGRDLCLCTSSERQPRYGRSTQVVESDANYSGLLARFAPRRAEAVGSPRLFIRRRENYWSVFYFCGPVERGFQRRADWDGDANGTTSTPHAL